MKQKYRGRFSLSTLGLGGGIVTLAITNWRLVLSLFCGIAIMSIVYQYPRSVSPNQKLMWSVLGGSGGIFFCYLLISVLQSYSNGWIGLFEIIQSIGIFSTLGIVLYQNITNRKTEKNANQLFLYLASEDNLTRLIALRQLQQRAFNQSLSFQQEQQLKEYCQIILEQEQSTIVSNTALETIEALQFLPVRQKLKHSNFLSILSQEIA